MAFDAASPDFIVTRPDGYTITVETSGRLFEIRQHYPDQAGPFTENEVERLVDGVRTGELTRACWPMWGVGFSVRPL